MGIEGWKTWVGNAVAPAVVTCTVACLAGCMISRTVAFPGAAPVTVEMTPEEAEVIDELLRHSPPSQSCAYWRDVRVQISPEQDRLLQHVAQIETAACASTDAPAPAAAYQPAGGYDQKSLQRLAAALEDAGGASAPSAANAYVRRLKVFVDDPTVVAETDDCIGLVKASNIADVLRKAAEKEFEGAGITLARTDARDVDAKTTVALKHCGTDVLVGYAEARMVLHAHGVTLWRETTAAQARARRPNQTMASVMADMVAGVAARLVRPAVKARALVVLGKQKRGEPLLAATAAPATPSTGAAPETAHVDARSPSADDPAEPETADTLFREGRELVKAGQWAQACEKFAESLSLEPAAGTTMNLADCEERLGKLMSARMRWEELVRSLPQTGDPRRDHAQRRLEQVDARLSGLTIRLLRKAPAGTRILMDSLPLGRDSVGRVLLLGPGDHVVSLDVPNRALRTYRVSLREGEKIELVLEPGDVATAGTSRP